MQGVPQQNSIGNLDMINFRWSEKSFMEIGTKHDIFSRLVFYRDCMVKLCQVDSFYTSINMKPKVDRLNHTNDTEIFDKSSTLTYL